MELFGGERGGLAAQGSATGTVQKVERALDEAIQARQEGRPEEAVERAGAALTWLDAGNVRRELRVGLPRELGLAHLLLGQTQKAREALLLSLEQAAHDPVLADPVRAALATLELMVGSPERARHMLDARGRNRRATLSAVARIALYEGDFQAAEQALQEADQAPGGTTASGVLHPPATVLRCFGAIWGKRPDQARMLYDGVATRDNPMWDLVRLALLRALWVQSGDGRYLQLAGGAAEQMRFGDAALAPAAPGYQAAVASMHATVLALSGELGLAVEAADQAMAQLGAAAVGSLTLPEWPRPAVLADCAMVYRDAGQTARWLEVVAQWDQLAWSGWAERMTLVSGARAKGATTPDEAKPVVQDGGASFEALAIRLLEDPRNARLAALRGIAAMASALGVEWTDAEGKVLGRIGAQAGLAGNAESGDRVTERVALGDGSVLAFFKPQRDAVRRLDRAALDGLSRVVTVREEEAHKLGTLHDAMTTAEAARRLAEERLEQARRPGTDKGHGGKFPTVIGRSDKLRGVLDRLGSLAVLPIPVLLEGAPGTGRRHLAQALFLALSEDPTGSSRAPMLDAGLVPEEAQKEALERLAKGARGGTAIVANVGALGAEASSWLMDELAAGRPGGVRWVATLDAREQGPLANALRKAFAAGTLRVPGLDERLEDMPLLTDQFIREAGRRPDDVSTATRAALARRVFAGHVAELRTLVRVATVRAGAQTIQPEHLERAESPPNGTGEIMNADDALTLGYREAVRGFQRALLQRALEATAGHNGRAADLLGLPRPQLVKLARELEVGLDLGGTGELAASDPGIESADIAVAV